MAQRLANESAPTQRRGFLLLKPDRDVLDVLLPLIGLSSVVVAAASVYIAYHAGDVSRHDAIDRDKREMAARAWDRDAGLIERLTNGAPSERRYATLMIQGLEDRKIFTPELKSTLAALAKGLPSDPVTQTAQKFSLASGAGKPVLLTTPPAVYIEYVETGQRCVADFLRLGLVRAGFPEVGVEQTAQAPKTTTVRFFDRASAPQADRVRRFMLDRGVSATVGDATGETTVPLPQLELRLARSAYPRVDERGNPVASTDAGNLLGPDCKPFVLGVSPLG